MLSRTKAALGIVRRGATRGGLNRSLARRALRRRGKRFGGQRRQRGGWKRTAQHRGAKLVVAAQAGDKPPHAGGVFARRARAPGREGRSLNSAAVVCE
jgi:hypothetical protein